MVTHSIAQQSFPKLSTYTLIYEVLSVAAVSTFQGLASFEYFFSSVLILSLVLHTQKPLTRVGREGDPCDGLFCG
jgi:hypothetical protein